MFDHFKGLAHKWLRSMTTFPSSFNLFHATGPFLYPLKSSMSLWGIKRDWLDEMGGRKRHGFHDQI